MSGSLPICVFRCRRGRTTHGYLLPVDHHHPMLGLLKKIILMTGPGTALQELLYAIIMALIFVYAARFGIVEFESVPDFIIVEFGMIATTMKNSIRIIQQWVVYARNSLRTSQMWAIASILAIIKSPSQKRIVIA